MNRFFLIIVFYLLVYTCGSINVNNENNNNKNFKISNNLNYHFVNNRNNDSNNCKNNSTCNNINNSDNNSKNYNNNKNNNNIEDESKIWVFFNSKDTKKFNLLKISKESNKRRIDRSLSKSSNTNQNYIDENDLKVSNDYINKILNCSNNKNSIKLNHKSNWLNSISILISPSITNSNNEIIECITNYSFVKSIDLVLKFKRTNNFHQQQVKENQEKEEEEKGERNEEKSVKILKTITSTTNNIVYNETFYGQSYLGIKELKIDKIQELGYNGSGIIILILDSGFYKSHQVFKHLNIIGEYNFVDKIVDTSNNYPGYESSTAHGTATLSLLAAYNPGVMVGAAFGSSILLAKTEDVRTETQVEEDDWIAAIEWGESLGATLVSSSLGYTDWYKFYQMDGTTRLAKITDIATGKGMLIVNSAGNDGSKGIGSPADGKYVITVGALDYDGSVASFSSVGPSADGRVKPDVMGLGVRNYHASSTSNSSYAIGSGTSYSCPLIASGIALLMQAHPTWTPIQIQEAILKTASNSLKPNVNTGYGTFNALDAFNYKFIVEIDNVIYGDNCSTKGCSGYGGCCNDICTCSVTHYGNFCQYEKIGCTYMQCNNRGGKCQIDKFNQSFICLDAKDTMVNIISTYDPRDICPVCTNANFTKCGLCGGHEDQCTLDIEKLFGSSNDSHKDNTHRNKLIIGLTVGIGGFLILSISLTLIILKNRKLSKRKNENNLKLDQIKK
ncbi:hypothetical protein RB653_007239 [Dictyostelium firmibasis]|uniref:Peptidase S8/S53 domain-containing protein n=1 Tax=Dictyostelium firmibasis TaxID=79012 RepID=A0AAN7TW79_9MYCE